MHEIHSKLIIVTGAPGSGKTTLARELSQAIRCPMICRDEIKEGLVNSPGSKSLKEESAMRHTDDCFFGVIRHLIGNSITHIAEAPFGHDLWSRVIEPMVNGVEIRIVICTLKPELARNRRIMRGLADPKRQIFHSDPFVREAKRGKILPADRYEPPCFSLPTLNVDTTNRYKPSMKKILDFVRGR